MRVDAGCLCAMYPLATLSVNNEYRLFLMKRIFLASVCSIVAEMY